MTYVSVIYEPVAFAVLIYAFFYDNKNLDVKFSAVSSFLAFLFFIFCLKLCVLDGRLEFIKPRQYGISGFLTVFLEDAFFVMIPYYISKFFVKSKTKMFFIWILFSLAFAHGHQYQGINAVIVTAFYPYFFSNNFAKKTTFGTVMMCHFMYDCFVYILPRLNNLLSLA
jgi:hypothetical protein